MKSGVWLSGLAALATGLAPQAMARASSAQPVIEPAPVSSQPATPAVPPATAPASGQPATPVVPGGDATPPPPQPVVVPVVETVMAWNRADAAALLTVIAGIDSEGLIPADYKPDVLRAALAKGEGTELDQAASKSFSWLAEDLRDGRTPVDARVQWFALDPDRDVNPTANLMARALQTHDVAGVLASLAPTYPDYAALKDALARTPASDRATRALIRANMDRWRWLRQDLGTLFLLTNIPEFQLRLATNRRIVRTYRTGVGKPGKTATPPLAETVRNVVFNPTWTVPQSIVQGEGMGARMIGNPAAALRQGYKVSRSPDGTINIVQQPGDSNSLGRMKIDMPNPHAIYLHDTPAKALFNAPVRAFSHGCVRTERAVELGMTMAIMGAGMTPEQVTQIWQSGKYTKVAMTQTFPVYLTYFTMGRDIEGNLRKFGDIYGRDAPVLASFTQPRQPKTTQRISDEPVVQLDNPL